MANDNNQFPHRSGIISRVCNILGYFVCFDMLIDFNRQAFDIQFLKTTPTMLINVFFFSALAFLWFVSLPILFISSADNVFGLLQVVVYVVYGVCLVTNIVTPYPKYITAEIIKGIQKREKKLGYKPTSKFVLYLYYIITRRYPQSGFAYFFRNQLVWLTLILVFWLTKDYVVMSFVIAYLVLLLFVINIFMKRTQELTTFRGKNFLFNGED